MSCAYPWSRYWVCAKETYMCVEFPRVPVCAGVIQWSLRSMSLSVSAETHQKGATTSGTNCTVEVLFHEIIWLNGSRNLWRFGRGVWEKNVTSLPALLHELQLLYPRLHCCFARVHAFQPGGGKTAYILSSYRAQKAPSSRNKPHSTGTLSCRHFFPESCCPHTCARHTHTSHTHTHTGLLLLFFVFDFKVHPSNPPPQRSEETCCGADWREDASCKWGSVFPCETQWSSFVPHIKFLTASLYFH